MDVGWVGVGWVECAGVGVCVCRVLLEVCLGDFGDSGVFGDFGLLTFFLFSNFFLVVAMADGDITDMQETRDAIVKGSSLDTPLSIIIVGVGDEDFEAMEELDADKTKLLATSGETTARDVVQFVSFKQSGGNPIQLTRDVLREVPKQLLNFMCANKRVPECFACGDSGKPMNLPQGDWYTQYYK